MTTLLYILVFIVGGLAGYVLAKKQNPDRRVQDLETLLRDLQARHDSYEAQVSSHFHQTASHVNNLTQAYKDLHEHLMQGAQTLCNDPKQAIDANPAKAFVRFDENKEVQPPFSPYHYPEPLEGDEISPPRDYATKQPDDKGTLDERFGFK